MAKVTKRELIIRRCELEFNMYVANGDRVPSQRQATMRQLFNIFKTSTMEMLERGINDLEPKYSFLIEIA